MVKRYPHSITISYGGGSLVDGEWTPGSATEVTTECRIEPAEAKNDHKVGQSGDVVNAQWDIFCPIFDASNNVPLKAKVVSNSSDNPVAFRAKEHTVLRFSIYQKHISMKV